jgi:hypothetical protein
MMAITVDARQETASLIGSDKVQGTAVMIEKSEACSADVPAMLIFSIRSFQKRTE